MYAVIKTGGKQYKVQAGDLLIVDRLAGEPGAKVAFEEVLMIGDGAAVSIGAPLIAGAKVSATLIETRKGEKIKVFKKIRRQGYRRTHGHRQIETVLRVTGIDGEGKHDAWKGEVDLTPLAELKARARNLARRAAPPAPATQGEAPAVAEPAEKAKPAAKSAARAKAEAKPAAKPKAEAKTAPAKPAAKPKAEAKPAAKTAPAKKPAAKKTAAKTSKPGA